MSQAFAIHFTESWMLNIDEQWRPGLDWALDRLNRAFAVRIWQLDGLNSLPFWKIIGSLHSSTESTMLHFASFIENVVIDKTVKAQVLSNVVNQRTDPRFQKLEQFILFISACTNQGKTFDLL